MASCKQAELKQTQARSNNGWLVICAATLALVAGAGQALAQYANGDGRGMQKNTDRYKNKEPLKTRDLRAEVQFRNAVVTGNAPGGASFRGTAPYAGDKDFRGSLGSDDLYRFRRDSTSTGYNGTGLRGTQSLQYQFGLQTGATVSRSDGGFLAKSAAPQLTADQARRAGIPQRNALDAVSEADIATTKSASNERLGAIRSTSAFAAARSLQPVYVGDKVGRDNTPVARLAASPLLGMKSIKVPQSAAPDSAAGGSLGAASASAGSPSTPSTPAGEAVSKVPTRTMLETARQDLAKGLGTAAGSTGEKDLLEERLDAIRRNLRGLPPKPGAPDVSQPSLPDVAWLRPTAPLIKSYVVVDRAPTDLYSIHMKSGQELSADGRFFDAEERYAKALSARPGDATAQVARVHAQTMAGMFVSAAVNLRTLIQLNPEVVSLRFDDSLIPRGGRTSAIKLQCREVIRRVTDGARADRYTRDTGLVLAYLGFLTDDREARIDGLWALASDATTPDGQADKRLAFFLEQVWQSEANKPTGFTPLVDPAAKPDAAPVAPAEPATPPPDPASAK
ncbi:MAG: hypothetical protein SFY96_02280 [Planctomycetota bacterium]|nr:hypothetical protein [Planctomycetota bacterium]